MEGVAPAQTTAYPIAGGQLINQQAGHPATHRLATDEHRSALLFRLLQLSAEIENWTSAVFESLDK
jgi:hypothetical protein